eukprot:Opistho-1_new@65537
MGIVDFFTQPDGTRTLKKLMNGRRKRRLFPYGTEVFFPSFFTKSYRGNRLCHFETAFFCFFSFLFGAFFLFTFFKRGEFLLELGFFGSELFLGFVFEGLLLLDYADALFFEVLELLLVFGLECGSFLIDLFLDRVEVFPLGGLEFRGFLDKADLHFLFEALFHRAIA